MENEPWIIGCEESQAITIAMRKKGIEAYSCDKKPCSGGHPEWHLQGDIFEVLKNRRFGAGIFNPPCTFVAGSASQWLSHKEDKHLPFAQRRPNPFYPTRREDMYKSIEFVKLLYASLDIVVIENPIGSLSSLWMKPTQIIQPYQFGDEATKTTCLWIKGLPKLIPTKIVGKGERRVGSSGKSHPSWYAKIKDTAGSKESVQELRSKTFPGIADAMATQWGLYKHENSTLFT